MTHAEQHRMILELAGVQRSMTRDDYELLDMFIKRDKDDEDLDEPSARRLHFLYDKYIVNRKRTTR